MVLLNNISQKLLTYRKACNLTQEQLAEKLYVTRQAVSKWERGESIPDIETLIGLSQLYSTTIDNLLSSQDEAKPVQSINQIKNEEFLKTLRKKRLKIRMTTFAIASLCAYVLICGILYTSFIYIFQPIWLIWLTFPIVPPIVFMVYFRNEIGKRWIMYFINVPFISLIVFSIIANYTQSYGGWLAFLFIPVYYAIAIIITVSEKIKKD
ncbi:XRE family transcriptional regulator [bacterium]|nr:XRE family transcriptional regulator [bacterium]